MTSPRRARPDDPPPRREAPATPRTRVVSAVTTAMGSPWLVLAVLLAAVAYLVGQRGLDGGAKMSHPGRACPADDEVLEI